MRFIRLVGYIMVTGMLATGGVSQALDVSDVTREWTPEGKKIAAERVKLPAHDEMVRIPAGSFIMGSDKKRGTEPPTPRSFPSGRFLWMPMISTSMK